MVLKASWRERWEMGEIEEQRAILVDFARVFDMFSLQSFVSIGIKLFSGNVAGHIQDCDHVDASTTSKRS